MCVAAAVVCWSLALLWQADVTQIQCDSYMWLVYLPASYVVHLINVKAYRLSVFMRTKEGQRPKRFTHTKVMMITLCLTLFTAIILLICTLADPLLKKVSQTDPYRPSLNRYHCSSGLLTTVLLYVLVIGHLIASLICVISVRNGMEAFRDGMIIKESFILLYACLFVAFVLHQLNLKQEALYVLRTAFLGLGITLFCLRLMISRCAKFWISEKGVAYLSEIHTTYVRPMLSDNVNALSNTGSSHGRRTLPLNDMGLGDDDEAPVYAQEVPAENSLSEMISVLNNPTRGKIFRNVARAALCMENINFVTAVLEYRREAKSLLVTHSGHASNRLRETAKSMIQTYVTVNADEEVNVSSKTRACVEKFLKEWPNDRPLITEEEATKLLEQGETNNKCIDIFEPAFKEICIMLYQNLWNKFRTAEMQQMAGVENSNRL